jgi:hypothetical protein
VIEHTELIEISDCCVAWGWTDGGSEEDGKGPVPPEDKEALRSDGGGKDDTTEDVPPDEAVPRSGLARGDDSAVAWAAGMLLMGKSRGLT